MDDFEAVTLRDPSSALTATYVPNAGMVATSLSDDGVELLGQRRGLQAYVSNHKTMGIPILYPWANRLSSMGYGVDGAVVTLTPGTGGVRTDQHGVPIHGTLGGYKDWTVTAMLESQLTAELDFAARPALLATFPFPHLLTLDITLRDRTLTVTTTVTATTGSRVPLCFGFHPYLQLPGVPRAQWQIETPAMRYQPVNAWGIPTGRVEQRPAASESLGDKFIDDGFDEVAPGSVFALSGGDRRIEVHFDEGFTAAQVFAPGDDDVVCFEPMAAPTDALRRGGYHEVQPGESAVARFRITVS
ncbi:galactose mutarotase-like enzyme [Mycolicibacterium chubuense NBB4]|uniref:Galactose mutarotase-like enzyme n=1 Tax=Mycolicibacterium chubuense (strain NBB4) TaxID=710421 RepID=I4BD79_MYCCN|nr:aldose 1-epimerase [Mycolicibacterium chubuense]AFM15236.1 galactose mutarotase-like enzyme [Mycolicibacterium chubuense NBB4]